MENEGFTEDLVCKKLRSVNSSQTSIQTISLWMIHHNRQHALIVKLWYKQLVRANEEKRKSLMYLANDIIQNSKRRGPEFTKEFHGAMKLAYRTLGEGPSSPKLKQCVFRLCDIWQERRVYDKKTIKVYKDAFAEGEASAAKKSGGNSNSSRPSLPKAAKPGSPIETPSPKGVVLPTSPKTPDDKYNISHLFKFDGECTPPEDGDDSTVDGMESASSFSGSKRPASPPDGGDVPDGKKFKDHRELKGSEMDVTNGEEMEKPDTDALIRALESLESMPSMDASIREKVANFPKEISDVTIADKLRDKKAGLDLLDKVTEAKVVVEDYNKRLNEEMEERKSLQRQLLEYVKWEHECSGLAQVQLKALKEKRKKLLELKGMYEQKYANCPSLLSLPNVQSSLAPLPTPGELFQARQKQQQNTRQH